MIPTSIDGTDITGATIDGNDVTEITIDGQTVFAATEFIDNFEDGNILEYTGSTGFFTTTTNNPVEGTTSLIHPSTATVATRSIISTSGLDNYPSAGDKFEVKTRASTYGDNQQYICFFASSNMVPFESGDGYFLIFEYNVTKFRLVVQTNGSASFLASTSVSFTNGETYTTEVDTTTGGSFAVTLKDSGGTVATLSASDLTHSSGGFGFAGGDFGANVDMYYDDAKIL